eukprot:gene33402-42899_t
MEWDMHYLVAAIARTITLEPGDVLLSGTPANSRPVQPGDVVDVEVEGLGRLSNTIVHGPTPIRDDCGAQPTESEELLVATSGPGASLRTTLATVVAITWLNPHVYLDTVVLLGTMATPYPAWGRALFAAGGSLASALWFLLIGLGARWLAPLFATPAAWRVLDGVTATTMLVLAGRCLGDSAAIQHFLAFLPILPSMRFKHILLAAAVVAALPLAAQSATFRWSRSVDISTWDIHTQNVGVNNTMHGAVYDTLVEYNSKTFKPEPSLATEWKPIKP